MRWMEGVRLIGWMELSTYLILHRTLYDYVMLPRVHGTFD
jgi:hypothetical protein